MTSEVMLEAGIAALLRAQCEAKTARQIVYDVYAAMFSQDGSNLYISDLESSYKEAIANINSLAEQAESCAIITKNRYDEIVSNHK